MRRLSRMLAATAIAIMLLFQAKEAYASVYYLWLFDHSDVAAMGTGTVYNPVHVGVSDWQVYINIIGKWGWAFSGCQHRGCGFVCRGTMCALGVFYYTRNTTPISMTGDGGLNFSQSTNQVQDLDASPMTAFTLSSLAFTAGIVGFLDEDIVHGAALTILALAFATNILVPGLKNMLPGMLTNNPGGAADNADKGVSDSGAPGASVEADSSDATESDNNDGAS